MEQAIERVEKAPALPERAQAGHKGTFGRVLIVGGSDEMIGAPVLAGMSALRMGAGLVQIAVPKAVLAAAISICPELIGLGLHERTRKEEQRKDSRAAGDTDVEKVKSAAESADAIVIGPGLGKSDAAKARLRALVSIEKPMVVDADALNILAALTTWPTKAFKSRAVLTPHPAEMRRLANLLPGDQAGAWKWGGKIPGDEESRIAIATLAARTFEQTIVLKGHRTVVTDGVKLYINTSGDSTLAKAGSGDILSGMIGCLLGQHLSPFEAGCLGVWLHGRAGESAGKKFGQRSAIGREVIGEIGAAIAEWESRPR